MLNFEVKKDEAFAKIAEFCDLNHSKTENIEEFVILLLKENYNFNLIGKSTIPDIWTRHILDSAQILKFIDDKNKKIADLGTGAGFPGIIISILGAKEVHLIEKSVRKCEFLRKAKILSPNPIFIHQAKAEEVLDKKFDILTSRALASLDKLLKYGIDFLKKDGYCLFLKGKNLENEIKEAKEKYIFDYDLFESLTAFESAVIKVSNISRKS